MRALLEEALANGHPVLLPRTALVETVWVLRSAFRIRKPEIVNLLSELLNAPPFMVAEEDLIRTALARWTYGSGDFADYVIAEEARRSAAVLVSFDQGLNGEEGIRVL